MPYLTTDFMPQNWFSPSLAPLSLLLAMKQAISDSVHSSLTLSLKQVSPEIVGRGVPSRLSQLWVVASMLRRQYFLRQEMGRNAGS